MAYFQTKSPVLVHFERALNGKLWYLLDHLVYFVVICFILWHLCKYINFAVFWYTIRILVICIRKNLATSAGHTASQDKATRSVCSCSTFCFYSRQRRALYSTSNSDTLQRVNFKRKTGGQCYDLKKFRRKNWQFWLRLQLLRQKNITIISVFEKSDIKLHLA
jgi:hypothetical protein